MADDTRPAADPHIQSTPTTEQVTVRDYLEKLWRRKWLAFGVFVAVLALTAVYILRTTPLYEARATLMLKSGDEANIFGRTGAFLMQQEPNAANYVEMLRSRSMAERVAEQLPDSLKLTPGTLKTMISARPVGSTDIIQLAASATEPLVAVTVVNAYAQTYAQYDLEQSRIDVSATRQFIENQFAVVSTKLDSAEQNLARFKRSHRLTDIDAETRALVDQQSSLAATYQQLVTDIQADEAQLAHIRSRIDEESKGMADRLEGISSPMVGSLKAALNQLEVERTNLMIRGFDESSERVRGLELQIDSTRARLRAESQALIAQQGFVDPVGTLSGLVESALSLDTKLAASKARREALAGVLGNYESSIRRLPEEERLLAALTRDVETGRRVHALLSERKEEARIQEVGKGSSVRVLDRARGATRTKPNVKSLASSGLALALMLALGSAWVAEYLDSAVRSPRELRRHGWPVLGTIPKLEGKSVRRRRQDVTSHLVTHVDGESAGTEAFLMLRSRLSFASIDRPLRTFVVTSPGPSEGKSTVSVNLAAAIAQAGSRVLLIDADLRHPTLHSLFDHRRQPGLSDLIASNCDTESAVFATSIDRLFCLPTGTVPPSPADLFVSSAATALLGRLAGAYDYLVIDTPPVLVGADAPILGSLVDATIMVIRAGRTTTEAVELATAAMVNTGARVAGYLLNGVSRSSRYGQYYYYYKYYSRYKHTPDAAGPAAAKMGQPGTADTGRAGGSPS